MTPIIGLSGLAGSGKTTLARYLADVHGYEIVPFAGPLKAMARAFGLTAREMAGDLKEAPCAALCGKTPRQFMQWLGTEFGRDMIGPDVWVESWKRRVDEVARDTIAEYGDIGRRPLVVADDVRFPNEAEAIRSVGGVVFRIERIGAGSATGAGHASEVPIKLWDALIFNNGTPQDMLAKVEAELTAKAKRDQSWAGAAHARDAGKVA